VTRVLLPKHNEKDLEDIQPELRKNLEFVFVEDLDHVILHALGENVTAPPFPSTPPGERPLEVAGEVEVGDE